MLSFFLILNRKKMNCHHTFPTLKLWIWKWQTNYCLKDGTKCRKIWLNKFTKLTPNLFMHVHVHYDIIIKRKFLNWIISSVNFNQNIKRAVIILLLKHFLLVTLFKARHYIGKLACEIDSMTEIISQISVKITCLRQGW